MQVPDLLVGVGWVVLVLGAAGLVGYWVTLRADHREHYGLGSYGETDPASKTNCPSCGARVDAGADECEHCGEALLDEESAAARSDVGSVDEADDRGSTLREGSN